MKDFETWWNESGLSMAEALAKVAFAAGMGRAEEIYQSHLNPPKRQQPDTDDWIKIRKEGGVMESGRAKDLGLWK